MSGRTKANWAERGHAVGSAVGPQYDRRGSAPPGRCYPPWSPYWNLLGLLVGPARVPVTKLLVEEPAHGLGPGSFQPGTSLHSHRAQCWPPQTHPGEFWGHTAHGCPQPASVPSEFEQRQCFGKPPVKKKRSQERSLMAKMLLQQHPQNNGQGLTVPSGASLALLPSLCAWCGEGVFGQRC